MTENIGFYLKSAATKRPKSLPLPVADIFGVYIERGAVNTLFSIFHSCIFFLMNFTLFYILFLVYAFKQKTLLVSVFHRIAIILGFQTVRSPWIYLH